MSAGAEQEKETPHMTAVRRQWKLNRLAKTRSTDDLETVLARARAEEKRLQAERAQRNPQIGQFIEGRGVYCGTWEPEGLGKKFNLFASPEDLRDEDDMGVRILLTFNDAAKRVAEIRDLCGHDGGNFSNDTELYAALGNGYNGEWFIPTMELLRGLNTTGNGVQTEDNLYKHRGKGDFLNFFNGYYWSCTETNSTPRYINTVHLKDGFLTCEDVDGCKLAVRPVRVELRR